MQIYFNAGVIILLHSPPGVLTKAEQMLCQRYVFAFPLPQKMTGLMLKEGKQFT